MKLNKFFVVSIFLLAILSVSAAGAVDSTAADNADILSAGYDKTVYVSDTGSDDNSGTQASPYKTINKGISEVNASDNAVIYLGEGTFTGENNTNLDVNLAHKNYNGSLTIIGAGDGKTILDGAEEVSIFKSISADSVITLINLTFINGKASNGAAISNNGILTIDNCVFENNYATSYAAVYQGGNNNLTIKNSIFNSNTGNNVADVYYTQSSTISISDSKFYNSKVTNNYASSVSLYIQNAKSNIFKNTFENMTASNSATAIYATWNNNENIANITGNKFINCNYTGSSGAIIYVQNSYIKGNEFINSSTSTTEIFVNTDYNAYLTFLDVEADSNTFVLKANVTDDMRNTVKNAKVIFYIDGVNVGTATSTNGVASLTVNKYMENGSYTISGTSSYNNNPFDVTVKNATLTVDFDHTPIDLWVATDGNDTNDGSEKNPFLTIKHALDVGVAESVDVRIHIKNGLYNGSGNRALSYSNTVKLTIIGESYGNVILDGENVTSGWSRAAMFSFGQNLEAKLYNLTIINTGSAVSGYSVYMKDMIVQNALNINIQSATGKNSTIDNLLFTDVYNNHLSLYNTNIYNSVFENNNAGTSTGLLWLSTSGDYVIRLENNTFFNNTIAGSSGGAAYYAQGNIISINNTFDSNKVTGTGTSIAYASANKITSINDTFTNNEVISYIAQFRSSGSSPEIIIENIAFINNTASVNGAGLATTGARINGAKFINNTAAGNGGAIYLLNHGSTAEVEDMVIENIVFENNNAVSGNDIYIVSAAGVNVAGDLKNLTITANDLKVTELSDNLVVSIIHPSGAVIGGGSVNFYLDGVLVGISDVINGNATLTYVGFKNTTTYEFSSVYSLANENDKYVNGTVKTDIAKALDYVDLYVSDSLGDDDNEGTLDSPFKTISHALNVGYAKSTNVTIHVLEGTYSGSLNSNIKVPGTIFLTIVGDGWDKTIITDDDASYFITFLAGNGKVIIENMTIKNASSLINSEFYVEEGANVEFRHIEFLKGAGNYGGAINSKGNVIITDSYFFDNGYTNRVSQNAIAGGAIYNDGNMSIYNTTFSANHAARLSTIASQGNLYIYNSNISDSINAYAMNMDLMAIGAYGGQIGNITIVNTTFGFTGKSIADLIGNNIFQIANSRTVLGIGSCEKVIIYNSVFNGTGYVLKPYVFSTINSWNLAAGGGSLLTGDVEVYNSTFYNIQAVNMFYQRTASATYHSNRLFDGCLFEDVDYLAYANLAGNYSLIINNSAIISQNIVRIGHANGLTFTMDISNNWWGDNNATYSDSVTTTSAAIMNYIFNLRDTTQTIVHPDNYLILTLNATNNTGLIQDITMAFKVYDGENITDYNGILTPREYVISATNGTLNQSEGIIKNNISISFEGIENEGYYTEATVDNQTVNITMDKLTIGDAVIIAKNITVYYGTTQINVSVLDNGKNATVGKIILKLNGTEYTANIINGTAVFDINVITGGSYQLEYIINDTKVFNYVTNSSTLTILNIVTNDTFEFFFDEDGNLRDEITAKELIFEGEISNKVPMININKAVTLLGENSTLTNIGINITSSDVVVDGFTLNNNAIAINVEDSDNVCIQNSKINVNGEFDGIAYAIKTNNACGVIITNNTICYIGKTNGSAINNGIRISDSDKAVIENNTISITIPSVAVGWAEVPPGSGNWVSSPISEGIVIDSSNDVLFKNNTVDISYDGIVGRYDTIYGIDIKNSNNAILNNNTLTIKGHTYIYGITLNGLNLNVSDNRLSVESDIYYANGIDVEGQATGIIKNNTITVNSPVVVYPIYSAMSNGDVAMEYVNNVIEATSDVVYGMELGGKSETAINNTITANGSYTMGIGSKAKQLIAKNNIIILNGKNIGSPSIWDSIPYETVGILSAGANADIENNNITSTGTYTVKITNGSATVTNNYLIASEYTGDASVSYLKGNTVKDNIPAMKKVNIEVKDIEAIYNNLPQVNATVTDYEGNSVSNVPVTLTLNGKTYSATSDNNGVATFSIDKVNVGKYTLEYAINSEGYTKENSKSNLTFTKAESNMVVDTNTPIKGENLTVNVTLPDDATGSVIIAVDNNYHTADIKDGKASVVVPMTTSGNHNINVTYSGNGNYAPSTFNKTINVESNIKVIAPSVDKYCGGSERFRVNVTDYDGKLLANKNVTVTINGMTYTKPTNANGTTTFPLNLNSGNYTVLIVCDDVSVSTTVTIKSTVSTKNVVMYYRNGTQFTATFIDTSGNIIANKDVTVNINGVLYTKTTKSNGVIKMNINLNPGTYVVTAENPVTGERATANVTVLSTLTDNKDIEMYFRNGTQYVVKVLDKQGNPLNNVEVTFNINGVLYTKTTKNGGFAKMNINLPPGNHVVSASYNGLSVSNNIKILPILSADNITMKFRDGTQFIAKLVDGQGNAYANQEVTFNINGMLYKRTTNANGQARLNINLMAGKYIITSSYNNSNIANTVTIS